ncbi:tetratricopeptide repeat protein [Pseudomonas sp. B21-053]|uniref:tetratricopeptide repeat protein n=1 Tax=Pseudomonas sp. B21-053 TaxID=2895493 RepID=UPI00222EED32|nr:sel1 repeat family protein [Pseudomonas sp. B21-053]UZE14984.1 sel1 repeat family protein [Pseudomonas sp. B21-053]
MRIYFLLMFLIIAPLSGFGAELTVEQQTAKMQGVRLYNQFKAISAVPYLEIAADSGDHEAQYYLGEALRKNNKHMTLEAQTAYEASALQGDIYAMIRLSQRDNDLCAAMSNCPAEKKSPSEWSKSALEAATKEAEKGDSEAMYLMYRITGDDKWFEKSAEGGFALSQYYLAAEYRDGKGFFLTPSKRADVVERWMKASAEGGNPQGMLAYAAIQGRKKDWEQFRHWNEKAAMTGYVSAVYGYGSYLAGQSPEYGFKEDLVTAYASISWVLELDGGGGMKEFAQADLPVIVAKMTPEQIEKSKKMLMEWKANRPPLSFFPDKL